MRFLWSKHVDEPPRTAHFCASAALRKRKAELERVCRDGGVDTTHGKSRMACAVEGAGKGGHSGGPAYGWVLSETVTLLSIGSRDVWIPGKEAIADLGLIEREMQRKKTLDADASQCWRGTKNAWRQVAQEESEQFPLLLWLLCCLAASLLLFLDAYSKQCETLAQSEQDALSWKEKMKKWKATAQEKAKAASSKIRALSPTSLRLPPTKSAAALRRRSRRAWSRSRTTWSLTRSRETLSVFSRPASCGAPN